MSDDPKMLAAEFRRLADCVEQLESAGDVLDQIKRGAILTAQQAAIICGTTDQAIYNWIDDSACRGPRQIGEKRATWMIGTARLLAYVEMYRGGLPARVKAENRLKEYWPIWSQAEDLRRGE